MSIVARNRPSDMDIMRLTPFILLIGLSACATFPQLEGTISDAARNAPFPQFTPLPQGTEGSDAARVTTLITPASIAMMGARIAALNTRAARLRRPVIDRATLARMRLGVDTSALQ